MRTGGFYCAGLIGYVVLLATANPSCAGVLPDFTGYSRDSGISVKSDGSQLQITWSIAGRGDASVTLDLSAGKPLITSLDGVLRSLDPLLALTVGSRVAPQAARRP